MTGKKTPPPSSIVSSGTWTPALLFGGTLPAGMTYTTQIGTWQLVGKLYFAQFKIVINAFPGGYAGTPSISGLVLPVASAAGIAYFQPKAFGASGGGNSPVQTVYGGSLTGQMASNAAILFAGVGTGVWGAGYTHIADSVWMAP